MKNHSFRGVLVLGLVSALGACKVIEYQQPAEPIDAPVSSSPVDAPVSSVDDAGGGGPIDAPGFIPAVACQQSGVAEFTVENFAYLITCGCKEDLGRVCTVPVGTTVTWTFADSEEHNLVSIANSFGMSPLLLAGQFTHTFADAGAFGYGCAVHSADMSGYQIIVE